LIKSIAHPHIMSMFHHVAESAAAAAASVASRAAQSYAALFQQNEPIPSQGVSSQPEEQARESSYDPHSPLLMRNHPWPFTASMQPKYTPPRPIVMAQQAVIIIDWTSLLFAVRRMELPVLLRAFYMYTRDLGIKSVVRVVMLMDPDGPYADLQPGNARDIKPDCAALYLECCTLSWHSRPTNLLEARKQPWVLRPSCVSDLCGRLNASSDAAQGRSAAASGSTPLLFFVSSRPHYFVNVLHHAFVQQQQILLVHGHDRQPQGLPAEFTQAMRPPSKKAELDALRAVSALPIHAGYEPNWLQRRSFAARAMIAAAWAVRKDDRWQLDETFICYSNLLVGIMCVWDLRGWIEYEQQFDVLPNKNPSFLPAACPYWNSGQPCLCVRGGGPLCFPHVCQGCGGVHTLLDCPVNNMLIPPAAATQQQIEAVHAPTRERMQLFTSFECTPDRLTSFRHWFELCAEALLLARNSSLSLPRESLIFVDWQNIHVPLAEVERFLDALRRFGESKGHARKVRRMFVLLDGRAVSDVAARMSRLEREDETLQVVSIDARKVQMMDSVLQRMLRSKPRPRTDHYGADDVVVVSGDSDFSPDMSRLVQLGHSVLLVHNMQARLGFKNNQLWDVRQDYMLLPQMAAYNALKMEQRAERQREEHATLAKGVGAQSSSSGGDEDEEESAPNGSISSHVTEGDSPTTRVCYECTVPANVHCFNCGVDFCTAHAREAHMFKFTRRHKTEAIVSVISCVRCAGAAEVRCDECDTHYCALHSETAHKFKTSRNHHIHALRKKDEAARAEEVKAGTAFEPSFTGGKVNLARKGQQHVSFASSLQPHKNINLSELPDEVARLRDQINQPCMSVSGKAAAEPGTVVGTAATAQKEQQDNFKKQHPYMEKLPPRPGKQVAFRCVACNILAGPMHRALAHALVPELHEKHTSWRVPPLPSPHLLLQQ
jgi:hypothetical protein